MPLLGIVAEFKNFPTFTKINLWRIPATRERGVYLHTLEDRKAEALQERGWWSRTRSDSDRGRFRSSTETTVPPRSTHVQPGDVSNALIQQRRWRGWGRAPAVAWRRGGGGACGDPAELR